ncbi:MAG: RedB protein [Myxococcota bacterium]
MNAHSRTSETLNDRFFVAGLAVIGALILTMMGGLGRYNDTPGSAATTPSTWPRAAGLPLHEDGLTLLMFVDPMCARTRAGLNELRQLMVPGGIHAVVLFAMPDAPVEDWSNSAAWELAAGIPGVVALPDPGEHEARMFGASAAGQVVVYDQQGQLVFRGGITEARGYVDAASADTSLAVPIPQKYVANPIRPVPVRAVAERTKSRSHAYP